MTEKYPILKIFVTQIFFPAGPILTISTLMHISSSLYQQLSAEVKLYIDTNCIERNKIMPAKTPGKYYSWMFYLRRATYNHRIMRKIAVMFLYKFERLLPEFNFQLCGLETAAAPIVSAIPIIACEYNLDLSGFMIRKNKKEYGLLNQFEGVIDHRPIVILDDLANSGQSLQQCRQTLLMEGLTVLNKAFVIVQTNYANLDPSLEIVNLFDLKDFDL